MEDQMNALKTLMREAFIHAKSAHGCCFSDSERGFKEDKISALSYAAACTAKYSAAAAIYWSNPDLWHFEVPELLAQFDEFTDEIRDDYRTDHSRQWVDVEFNRLEQLFNESVFK